MINLYIRNLFWSNILEFKRGWRRQSLYFADYLFIFLSEGPMLVFYLVSIIPKYLISIWTEMEMLFIYNWGTLLRFFWSESDLSRFVGINLHFSCFCPCINFIAWFWSTLEIKLVLELEARIAVANVARRVLMDWWMSALKHCINQ